MADDTKNPGDAEVTVEVTNNDSGPRYVHTLKGMVVLPAGETATYKMRRAEVESAASNIIALTDDAPVFTIKTTSGDEQPAETTEKPLADLTVAQLRKLAEVEVVDLGSATKSADIIALILAKRAERGQQPS